MKILEILETKSFETNIFETENFVTRIFETEIFKTKIIWNLNSRNPNFMTVSYMSTDTLWEIWAKFVQKF